MRQCAEHGVGREAAECAERAEFHGVAEVFDKREVFGDPLAVDDLLDGLDATGRADPARRAFAAGFVRAEIEDVMDQLNTKELAHAITELETDDAVEVIESLDRDAQRQVLSALPVEERDALRTVLSYPD